MRNGFTAALLGAATLMLAACGGADPTATPCGCDTGANVSICDHADIDCSRGANRNSNRGAHCARDRRHTQRSDGDADSGP
jgi:hypothetical protein